MDQIEGKYQKTERIIGVTTKKRSFIDTIGALVPITLMWILAFASMVMFETDTGRAIGMAGFSLCAVGLNYTRHKFNLDG